MLEEVSCWIHVTNPQMRTVCWIRGWFGRHLPCKGCILSAQGEEYRMLQMRTKWQKVICESSCQDKNWPTKEPKTKKATLWPFVNTVMGRSAYTKPWGISWPADYHCLKDCELQNLWVCYNAQVNEPKFYLPFLAEGGSGNESARPNRSAGVEASVNLPAGSDCSYSGLKQAYTKSAV